MAAEEIEPLSSIEKPKSKFSIEKIYHFSLCKAFIVFDR
jgi:hypothetical protein